jgi:hypothetical protein
MSIKATCLALGAAALLASLWGSFVTNSTDQRRKLEASFCCTWDFKECSTDSWCKESQENCESDCEGFWRNVDILKDCVLARWQYTEDGEACCDEMTIVQFEDYTGCGFVGRDGDSPYNVTPVVDGATSACCTWNMKECSTEPYCNENKNNCQADCEGFYLDISQQNASCVPRGDYSDNASNCCTSLVLVHFDDYIGCGLPIDGTGKIAQSPNYCCTWDFKNCTATNPWCDEHANNCENSCEGYYRDVSLNEDCLGRWFGTDDASKCCENMVLVQWTDPTYSYSGCGIEGVDGEGMYEYTQRSFTFNGFEFRSHRSWCVFYTLP